jgi:chromosome segregation ATPase
VSAEVLKGIADLEEERRLMAEKLAGVLDRVDALELANSQLAEELDQAQQQLKSLQQTAQEAQQHRERLQTEQKEHTEGLTALRSELQTEQTEGLAALRSELQTLGSHMAALQFRQQDMELLKAEIENLHVETAAALASSEQQLALRKVREELITRANERKFNNLEKFYKMQTEQVRRQGRPPPS